MIVTGIGTETEIVRGAAVEAARKTAVGGVEAVSGVIVTATAIIGVAARGIVAVIGTIGTRIEVVPAGPLQVGQRRPGQKAAKKTPDMTTRAWNLPRTLLSP